MCGIVGVRRFDGRPVSEDLLRAMTARLDPSWARRRGLLDRRPDRLRPPSAVDHRRGRLTPADGDGRRPHARHLQRRDLQLPPAPRGRPTTPSAPTATPRCCSRCFQREGARSVERLRGPVRLRDPRRRRPVAVPRPARRAAAVHLPATTTCSRSPPRSRRCCRRSRPRRRSTWPASTPTCRGGRSPLRTPCSRTSASCCPATAMRVGRRPGRRRPSPTGPCRPGPARSMSPRRGRRPGLHRSRGRGPQRPGRRRAGRLAAQRWRRQQPHRRPGHEAARRRGRSTRSRPASAIPRYDELPARPRGQPAPSAPTTTRSWSTRPTSPSSGRGSPGTVTLPLSEPADVAVFELASLARQSVKVLLSGEGSDELFAGYPKYKMARWTNLADALPAGAARSRRSASVERRLPPAGARARIALRTLAAPTELDRLASWFAPFTARRAANAAGRDRLPAPRRRWPARGRRCHRAHARLRLPGVAGRQPARARRPHVHGRVGRAAAAVPRPPPGRARLLPAVRGEGAPGPDQVGAQAGGPPAPARRASSTAARSASGCRSTPGSATTSGRWPATCCSGRARSSAPPSTRVAVRDLLDTHESGRRDESIRIWTLLSLEVWHDVYFRSGDGSAPPLALGGRRGD